MRFSFIAPLSPRCPVLLVVSVAVPPHIARRGFPSRGGGNSRGSHIFRAVFLSSSYPPQLIASSVQRLTVPSGRASKQARQDGGRSSAVLGPVIVSPPRLVIAPSRPSCRMGRAKSVSFPSVPCRHRARASPHRSPWLKRFNHSSPRARSHPGKQAGKGGPSPFRPSYRQAGSHRPTPIVAPSSARRASKQDGGGSHSVRPPRPRPASRVGPIARPRPVRLIDGKGKQNAPLPLSRNGAKSVHPLYRTRELQ